MSVAIARAASSAPDRTRASSSTSSTPLVSRSSRWPSDRNAQSGPRGLQHLDERVLVVPRRRVHRQERRLVDGQQVLVLVEDGHVDGHGRLVPRRPPEEDVLLRRARGRWARACARSRRRRSRRTMACARVRLVRWSWPWTKTSSRCPATSGGTRNDGHDATPRRTPGRAAARWQDARASATANAALMAERSHAPMV